MSSNRNQNNRFRPNAEALEERSLMACNVFVDGAGVLNIVGDGANDYVTLYDNGHGDILGVASGVGPFSFSHIKDISIDTGAGNDTVNYTLMGDLQAGTTHTMSVNLRGGDDVFNASLYNYWTGEYSDMERGSLYLMKVVGEDGNDRMFLDAGDTDMRYATMKMAFYGGQGDDIIGMNYAGLVDHGGVSFFAYGNEGNDQIRMSMIADPASVAPAPGGFRGIIEGNDGDDTIYFDLSASSAVGHDQTSIDGGRGADRAFTNIDTAHIYNIESLVII